MICSCCCDITFMKRVVTGLAPESTCVIVKCRIVVCEVVKLSINILLVPLRWITISQFRIIQRHSLVAYLTRASIAGNPERQHSQWLQTGPYTNVILPYIDTRLINQKLLPIPRAQFSACLGPRVRHSILGHSKKQPILPRLASRQISISL